MKRLALWIVRAVGMELLRASVNRLAYLRSRLGKACDAHRRALAWQQQETRATRGGRDSESYFPKRASGLAVSGKCQCRTDSALTSSSPSPLSAKNTANGLVRWGCGNKKAHFLPANSKHGAEASPLQRHTTRGEMRHYVSCMNYA